MRHVVVQLAGTAGDAAWLPRLLAVRGVAVEGRPAGDGAGQLELEVDDAAAARAVLREVGCPMIEGDPIRLVVPDRPGTVAELAGRLAEAGIRITAILASPRPGALDVALCVDDAPAALALLGPAAG